MKNSSMLIPAPTGHCFCGCGRETNAHKYFAQGHDKRAESMLTALEHQDSIVTRLVDRGYGPGGKNLQETAIGEGVRERCGFEGCSEVGVPGGAGLRQHRMTRHGIR